MHYAALYVKVYLMRDSKCLAKFRTRAAEYSSDPVYMQRFAFRDTSYAGCVLQVIAWTRRNARKSLIGLVQISLDDLNIAGKCIRGWYRLMNISASISEASFSSKHLRRKLLYVDEFIT